jgi:predicted AAA+ superfamily ATPase
MSYERPLKATLLFELSSPTSFIQALIGPRQVGKTTIARQIQAEFFSQDPQAWLVN